MPIPISCADTNSYTISDSNTEPVAISVSNGESIPNCFSITVSDCEPKSYAYTYAISDANSASRYNYSRPTGSSVQLDQNTNSECVVYDTGMQNFLEQQHTA